METVDELVRKCIATQSKPAQGARGTATVLLIEEQQDIFITLFLRMKEYGYSAEDLTRTHKKMLVDACCPKHKTAQERKSWDYKTLQSLTIAEVAVFESVYSPDAKPIDDNKMNYYRDLVLGIAEKVNEFEEAAQSKGDNSFLTSDGNPKFYDEFIPHPESKPVDESVFKEPMPNLIENDYSWIAGGIKK